MSTSHVEELLVPLMRGELDASERGRVEIHLAGCAECRDARADFERVSAALARPAAPAVHWGAYRAQLREKLEARTAPPSGRSWLGRLQALPVAMAAGLVAVMIYVGVPGLGNLGDGDPGIEDTVLASRLDLVERLDLVQRLDLLEDLDVIRRLDGLDASREG